MTLRYTMDDEHVRDRHPGHMNSISANRRSYIGSATGRFRLAMVAASLCLPLGLVPVAGAQISLTTAVDLALRSNPRVQAAEADVARARAQVSETLDVYIPVVAIGAGLGQAYGYSPNPPTLAAATGTSLVYGSGQVAYIRSAEAGEYSARLALRGVRDAVAEDTALAFVALDHDQQREQALHQQTEYADKLITIVQERVDAGQDNQIDLTQAKLTAAQLRLSALRAQDDTAGDREHLARLIGVPATALNTDGVFPATPPNLDTAAGTTVHGYANASVASAFATADAKQLQAKADANFRFKPQVSMFAQYNRYATFSDSFTQLQNIYKDSNGHTILTANEGFFGVQISIPVFDKGRGAKARESAAEAAKLFHDAQNAENDALDGQTKIRHAVSELHLQADVAGFQQQLAQQKLDVLRVQLQNGSGNPNGPQMTPKDEQNARIDERDKYLAVIDASFQLRQAEIQLLRQTGGLEEWLKSAVSTPQPASGIENKLPAAPSPQP